ncbi:Ig-like domain-containing protein [Marinobacter sp. SS21]|uniref:Ig-like domain-containing protein n=1 Tax=Marinobacter sp. SS21 TaxID=2979460 RepID=UPI00232E7FD6|nr:Ig-like domain-containing protein [Marinobacter sp. SS21]MDC0661013.1 Ig-like domain-containing protein [Marinobacter sp. SS21]
MKFQNVIALAVPLIVLAGCGAEESTMKTPEPVPSLIYSYPADGQAEIATRADLVLRFSTPVAEPQLLLTEADSDRALDHTLTAVDGGRSWVVSPRQPLAPVQRYRLSLAEPLTVGTQTLTQLDADGELVFTTQASTSTIRAQASTAASFMLERMIPDGDLYPVMDFSTLRLTLTQAIHPEAVVYGESVRLEDSAGNLVPAYTLARGRQLVIDPLAADGSGSDQLTPGESYTLVIRDLPNLHGDALLNLSQTLTPRESGPTEVLYQTATTNSSAQDLRSILNGKPVNGIALSSVLLGQTPNAWQTGEMWAELAYSPNYPTMTPLRIPRGTVLSSTSLDVNVGGVVPLMTASGVQQTGEIRVVMTTDAIGYLYRNPFSDADDAPRHVRLFMDVSMNTEHGQPNASLSQDLIGLELVGVAMIHDGALEIDALSMVQPRLLGLEDAVASLAFNIRAETRDRAQENAPAPEADVTGPVLRSWMPDDTVAGMAGSHRPGDPITLFFDEPLDRQSARAGLRLFADGAEVAAFNAIVDGTSVTVNPVGGLEHGRDYELQIDGGLTDLAGNGSQQRSVRFSLPPLMEQSASSPLAVASYPGFPCVTTGLDLNNGSHGRCDGALDGNGVPYNQADEAMPVHDMPANRPLMVTFSQTMDLSSIRLQDTLKVERITDLGSGDGSAVTAEPVPGRLALNHQRLHFYPDQPWQPGVYYRYTLVSQASASPDCRRVICSAAGQALETNALWGLSNPGGPDLTIYFRGAAPTDTVFLPLRNLPVRDVNADNSIQCGVVDETNADGVVIRKTYAEDCAEAPDVTFDSEGVPLTPPQATRVVSTSRADARVGCNRDRKNIFSSWIETDCPELKFIYQTGALYTEVVGPVDPDNPEAGVRVLLHPTLLTTNSLTVHAKVLTDLTWAETPTGKQIIRMRYAEDDQGNRSALIPGLIRTGDDGFPVFETDVNLYLDAPDLETPLNLPHNQHSIQLDLNLLGGLTFLDDGRQVIEQYNQQPQIIPVDVAGLVQFDLEIPVNGLRLSYLSAPVKELSVFMDAQ